MGRPPVVPYIHPSNSVTQSKGTCAGSDDERGHDAGNGGSNMGVMAAAGLNDLIKALQDAGTAS